MFLGKIANIPYRCSRLITPTSAPRGPAGPRGRGSWTRLLAVVVCAIVGCSKAHPGPAADAGGVSRLVVAGSSALLPLITDAANNFMRTRKQVAIEASAGGSRQGLARVLRGEIAIGTSDVPAEGTNAALLEDHKVALVGIAAMAHRGPFNEHIESLTLAELRGIFSGSITNWSQIGGGDQPIVLINRSKDSGTRITFGAIVLGGDNFLPGPEQESSSLVQTALEQTPGAISYLALSYRRDSLKCFSVEGIAPTPANIARGSYPIRAFEHMYTFGPAKGETKEFIDYILSPSVQNDLVPKIGLVPIGSAER